MTKSLAALIVTLGLAQSVRGDGPSQADWNEWKKAVAATEELGKRMAAESNRVTARNTFNCALSMRVAREIADQCAPHGMAASYLSQAAYDAMVDCTVMKIGRTCATTRRSRRADGRSAQ